MDDVAFIVGLMRHNSDALGFIPDTRVTEYVQTGRYIIQRKAGLPVGYILHGKPTTGGILSVAQAVIEYDFRGRGFGGSVFDQLIERARQTNCRGIKLRCASNLPSNDFWRAEGLEHVNTLTPENRRKRAINIYMLDLWKTLFDIAGR